MRFFLILFFNINISKCSAESISPDSRIIGGVEANREEWSFLVRFKYIGCGATIIGHRWVITAAHCVVADGIIKPGKLY